MLLNRILPLAVLGFLTLLLGCVTAVKSTAQGPPLEVSFTFEAGGGLSAPNPEIRLANIPDGSAFFTVRLKDIDRPNFNHGGGTVPNDGSGVIRAGVLSSYRGPAPPVGETHTYVLSVIALNADKSLILGEGQATRRYP